MNYYVLNTQSQPLYIIKPYAAAAKAGNAYTISFTANTPNNQRIAVNIQNPSSSRNLIYINNIYIVNTVGASTIALYSGAALGSATALLNYNTNLGSSNTSVATTQSQGPNATVSGGTLFSTTAQGTAVYNEVSEGGIIIQPNNSLAMLVTNASGSPAGVYIKVNYWEEVMQ